MRYAFALLFILGCSSGMTNAEIIAETKMCTDAGLTSTQMRNGLTNTITRIECGNPIGSEKYIRTDVEACIALGGVPITSVWDSSLSRCEFKETKK